MLAGFDWEKLKQDLLKEHSQYGSQPFYPAIDTMVNDIETVYIVYGTFPETCAVFLKQATEGFTESEYDEEILSKLRKRSKLEPSLTHMIASLSNLRKYMGGDPEFLKKSFHREIEILNVEDKFKTFSDTINMICREAIQIIIGKLSNTAGHSGSKFSPI